jgi:hypothetical protein
MEAWRSGRVVGNRPRGSWFAPSKCSSVFSGHGTSNVKLRILECFTLYLRNRQSGNLRAIENCICGLRSIERNMRFFLRTVSIDDISFWPLKVKSAPLTILPLWGGEGQRIICFYTFWILQCFSEQTIRTGQKICVVAITSTISAAHLWFLQTLLCLLF